MAKQPTVPVENRSPHEGAHRPPAPEGAKAKPGKEPIDPEKHGQQANTRQNTTHQGYQQDR